MKCKMQGAFHHLMKEVRLCDTSRYRNLVRMDTVTFEELLPSTEQEWLSIAEEFLDKWNFKNGIGVMDGKHVIIRPPTNSDSYYFNYNTYLALSY